MKAKICRCAMCKEILVEKDRALDNPILHKECQKIALEAAEATRQKYEPGQKQLACHKCGTLYKFGLQFKTGQENKRKPKRVWCEKCFKDYIAGK